MKLTFNLGGKKLELTPYTTSQEKDILLLDSFNETNLDKVLDILNFETNYELSEEEKKIILYKYREISLGDELNVSFVCDECGQSNERTLEASNFFEDSIRNDDYIKKLNKKVTDDNLHEFVDIDVDDLDIDEFEELKQKVTENQIKVNFIKSTTCLRCKEEKKFDLSNNKYIIEIMSDESLMTLYKSYNFLIFFGNYSKLDIDSMLPFERTIFMGLLTKTKEDLAK